MRTSLIVASACLSAASAFVALPARADYVQSANAPPPARPAETTVPRAAVHSTGFSASGGLGTGIAGTYAFGLEARAGFTWENQLYLGGNVQYYSGNSVNNTSAYALFFGPELGYRYYPIDQLEIRPFAMIGLAFDKQVSDNPFSTTSHNAIAIQPGALWLWHFTRDFYAGLDTHFFMYPSPVSLSLIAMAGANF